MNHKWRQARVDRSGGRSKKLGGGALLVIDWIFLFLFSFYTWKIWRAMPTPRLPTSLLQQQRCSSTTTSPPTAPCPLPRTRRWCMTPLIVLWGRRADTDVEEEWSVVFGKAMYFFTVPWRIINSRGNIFSLFIFGG